MDSASMTQSSDNRHGAKRSREKDMAKAASSRLGTTPATATETATASGETLCLDSTHFQIGLTSDCNKRFRKSMEDAQVVIPDFMGFKGCFYLAVFDGHAGKQSSAACAANLHELVATNIADSSKPTIAENLALSFEQMDEMLKKLNVQHSGTTAAVAVSGYIKNGSTDELTNYEEGLERRLWMANVGDARGICGVCVEESSSSSSGATEETGSKQWEARRLTYDHKGSDEHERKRISNAGGIVLHNRVNGMLAVTRSLGDLFMKEYVVGLPYTTNTLVSSGLKALVIASDGLWDVCSDQEAVDIVRQSVLNRMSAQECSAQLLEHAVQQLSADNLTVIVALFK